MSSSTLRDEIKRAVDALDPEGLLALGAPADEYDPEVNDFVALAADGGHFSLEIVTATWLRWFGSGRAADSRPSMERLTNALNDAASRTISPVTR